MKEPLCLDSQTAFISHYSESNILLTTLQSASTGLSTAGTVIGASAAAAGVGAMAAGPTGLAAIASHFTALPLIGAKASAYVATATAAAAKGAAVSAAVGAIPAAVTVGITVSLVFFFNNRRIKKRILGPSSLDEVARIVGEIVFLPMFGVYNDFLQEHKNNTSYFTFAKQDAFERIKEWGYSDVFVNNLLQKNLGKKSKKNLDKEFSDIIQQITKIKNKKAKYKSVSKYEIKEKLICELAKIEVNSLQIKSDNQTQNETQTQNTLLSGSSNGIQLENGTSTSKTSESKI